MNVHYVSGSRADFGLMRGCLRAIAATDDIKLAIVLTGQATVTRYGEAVQELADDGFAIAKCIPVSLSGADGREMALAMAEELRGLTDFWSTARPDLMLVLGDRGEMLAAALAAFHLEIPFAHIHGGERSGTLDEGFRHAISKLATYHFVASEDSRERLIRMGETDGNIHVIGAPGLVEVAGIRSHAEGWFLDRFGLSRGALTAVMLFHPVVQESDAAYAQCREILWALARYNARVLVLRPNSDAGGSEIDRALNELPCEGHFTVINHLARQEFLEAVASANVLIGNSSSGIIESASIGTPCVNLGTRQEGRLRNDNTVDCPQIERDAIVGAIQRAAVLRGPFINRYGDGRSDQRLVEVIGSLPLTVRAPKKQNAY